MEMTSLGNDLSRQSTSHCTLLHCLESVSGNLELLTPMTILRSTKESAGMLQSVVRTGRKTRISNILFLNLV